MQVDNQSHPNACRNRSLSSSPTLRYPLLIVPRTTLKAVEVLHKGFLCCVVGWLMTGSWKGCCRRALLRDWKAVEVVLFDLNDLCLCYTCHCRMHFVSNRVLASI